MALGNLQDATHDYDMQQVRATTSVVIITNLVPSAPGISVIQRTLDSLQHLKSRHPLPLLVVGDGIKARDNRNGGRLRWNEYKKNLKQLLEHDHTTKLRFRNSWGHISQTLRLALAEVQTDYVLVVQHDLPFVQDIDLDALVHAMQSEPNFKHVRFNLRSNHPAGQDAMTTRRAGTLVEDRSYFFQQRFGPPPSRLPLVQTLSWSDNNFVCSTRYLSDTILRPIGRFKVAPEWVFNNLGTPENHSHLGTYVFGKLESPPTIEHTDGRRSGRNPGLDATPASPGTKLLWRINRSWNLSMHRLTIWFLSNRAQSQLNRGGAKKASSPEIAAVGSQKSVQRNQEQAANRL